MIVKNNISFSVSYFFLLTGCIGQNALENDRDTWWKLPVGLNPPGGSLSVFVSLGKLQTSVKCVKT